MSLTSGRGPLSKYREGRFTAPIPDDVAYVEPFHRRVRGVHRGTTVVDTEAALLVHRPGHAPIWALPPDAVDGVDSLPVPEAPGYVEVPWAAVDEWFQEEQRIRLHAPNPYHRVETVPTSRRLRVEAAGTVLVDTTDTLGVYETALPARLYVDRRHVRMDLLEPSATVTHCPYKGDTTYWNARIGDTVIDDVAWSYDDPITEAAAIAGMLSFETHKLDVTTDLP